MEQPKLLDNISLTVGDDLKTTLSSGGVLDIASEAFSIRAFSALRNELKNLDHIRFIYTTPAFANDSITPQQKESIQKERLIGSGTDHALFNALSQKSLALDCAAWVKQKVQFKAGISGHGMSGFMVVENPDVSWAYQPIVSFSSSQLGYVPGGEIRNIVTALPTPMAETFLRKFNECWFNEADFKDVTSNVLRHLEELSQENAPEYLYFSTLYMILEESHHKQTDDSAAKEGTGFKATAVWNKLYNFQQDAALAIIEKLEKYNGCILADSVGLGKTFTALAVIKYYENRNQSVLVLCPKKLNDNWIAFKSNYKNNPLASDRLRYDILFHTDLSRDRGFSNGIDLERINWSNYDLVVIDESHNFRNGGTDSDVLETEEDEDEHKENRYDRLMNKVMRSGIKTKVLMLSATPVNNRFNDLKNQLRLAYEGDTQAFDERLDLKHGIDEIFKQAQKEYNRWSKLPASERTADNLIDRLDFDFFNLLDAVTIARSRSHIAKYYNTEDIGNFPKRQAPISRYPELTDLKGSITFAQIAKELEALNLCIYTPSLYLLASARGRYSLKQKGITMDGREKGLRKLMAVNLLKRLESSVNSFRITLEKIRDYIGSTVKSLDDFQNRRNDSNAAIDATTFVADADDDENAVYATKKSQVRLCDLDRISYRRDLVKDLDRLNNLLDLLGDISPEHDGKLTALKQDLEQKIQKPFNAGNRKILIFTAFADTAEYLYGEISAWAKQKFGLESALVTGKSDGRCSIKGFSCSYNNILTWFSPKSKDRSSIAPNADSEIDILIATDCISEGQNLQDCDCVLNFDIHWNPVRLIQRFGRIDRIGSQNDSIMLINYWPAMSLDEYIKLKARVESRMTATVITSAGDDDPLSDSALEELEYRRNQLKRLQEEIVNLEDLQSGISIMDLGLNEFRMELQNYLKTHPEVKSAPSGIYAVTDTEDPGHSGVIFVLKKLTADEGDTRNPLRPYYLIEIADDGSITCDHLHPRRVLDCFRLCCKGRDVPDEKLCSVVNRETGGGKRMKHYEELLRSAVGSIINLNEESEVLSLFSEGETTALNAANTGLDDFELVSFLIIKAAHEV